MADFKTQIAGLTDIAISASSSPTQDEVSQFLVDGTVEVINRITQFKPYDLVKFTDTTEDESGSGITVTGQVLSVVREHDSATILRKCDAIDPNLRYEASNIDSLHYRSKHKPGYYVLNGKLQTVPAAATSNNSVFVTQTSYATNTTYESTSIDNFPKEYEYLVVLNASMKSLLNAMGAMHASFASGSIKTAFTNANTAIDRLADNIYNNVDNYDAGVKRFKQVKKAMDNALKMFDGGFPTKNTDVRSFIAQEDPEMIEKTLTAISIELKQAEMALTEMAQITDIPIKEAQMHLAEITSRLGADQQEYTWYNARYTSLKQEYDTAFSLMAPRSEPPAQQQRARRG
tara:strand:+ start:881 stop:1915 length:1035 start_codon:yes stop_codon:yes gene_type:complete